MLGKGIKRTLLIIWIFVFVVVLFRLVFNITTEQFKLSEFISILNQNNFSYDIGFLKDLWSRLIDNIRKAFIGDTNLVPYIQLLGEDVNVWNWLKDILNGIASFLNGILTVFNVIITLISFIVLNIKDILYSLWNIILIGINFIYNLFSLLFYLVGLTNGV